MKAVCSFKTLGINNLPLSLTTQKAGIFNISDLGTPVLHQYGCVGRERDHHTIIFEWDLMIKEFKCIVGVN
jgi:hypothetical protein